MPKPRTELQLTRTTAKLLMLLECLFRSVNDVFSYGMTYTHTHAHERERERAQHSTAQHSTAQHSTAHTHDRLDD